MCVCSMHGCMHVCVCVCVQWSRTETGSEGVNGQLKVCCGVEGREGRGHPDVSQGSLDQAKDVPPGKTSVKN